MKIAIINNWNNTETFFVYKLLKKIYNEVELINDSVNCDILIHSVFGNNFSYQYTKAKYKIFCTWETRFYIDIAEERIPYSDMVLSYRPTNDKFFRFPLWYQWIDWWNENTIGKANQICGQSHAYIGGNLLPNNLVPNLSNIIINQYPSNKVWERPYFAAMLVGNKELDCVLPRKEIYDSIVKNVFPVHGFGELFNNRFEGNKIDLLLNFKSNICYENSIHEGYVTEKLFDAIFAGCLPIYNGDPKYSKIDFNEKRFLNRQDYTSTEEFVKEIKTIILDKSKFCDIIDQPMFRDDQIPSLSDINNFLFDKIKL